MDSVRNKVVLITGASSGIGAGTALEFAKYGSRLALTGRNTERLEAVGRQCEQQGLAKDKILLISAELTIDEDIKRIVDTTVDKFGAIDVLVNNAAIEGLSDVQNLSMDLYDKVQRVNVRAVIYLTKLTIPYLKVNKGSIINISSVGGLRSFYTHVAYCMSKAALDMLTKSLSLELAADNVRVNSVNSGGVRTSIFTNAGFSPEADNGVWESAPSIIPMRRLATAQEIAQSIVYLASDAASYVTGNLMSVDGGMAQMTVSADFEKKTFQ